MSKPMVKLMLDSGAFSAWNRGEELDIGDYVAYVKKHKHLLFSYVSMDVIPQGMDRSATNKAAMEEAARRSYENLQDIKRAGLSPIPVFHQGEEFKWLEKMLGDGERYIGFSSAKDLQLQHKRRWLDQVFSIITDKDGVPLIKTHGFGITQMRLLHRYPWYTVDSTTWSLSPGFGSVLIPPMNYKTGKPDFTEPPINIILSGVKQKWETREKMQFQGLAHLAPKVAAYVEDYLYEMGVTPINARYMSTLRRKAMLLYFMRLCEALGTDRRFLERKPNLTIKLPKGLRKPAPYKLQIMFATNLNREWGVLMNECNCDTRLLSYYDLKDRPSRILEEFVTKGVHGEYKPRAPKQDYNREVYCNWRRMRLSERPADLEKRYGNEEKGPAR